MPDKRLFVGLDLGTSGARAVVIDAARREIAMAKSAMADHGADIRDPHVWWAAAQLALRDALAQVDADQVAAIAVDGTSSSKSWKSTRSTALRGPCWASMRMARR